MNLLSKTIVSIFLFQSSIALSAPINLSSPGFVAAAQSIPSFSEPFVRAFQTSAEEDDALSSALADFSSRPGAGDRAAFVRFLDAHPNSGWAPAVAINLGLAYLHDGHFSKALVALEAAWKVGRHSRDPQARALVDRAVGELARLRANLGHNEQLAALFDEIGDRPVTGSATETIQTAKEQLILVKEDPRHLFNCGPLALRALLLEKGEAPEKVNYLQYFNAGEDGTTLSELSGLATNLNFEHDLVLREPGQLVPVPSIIHWKVGHFAAVIGEANGRYQVRDAVFPGSDIWVTKEALDAEATGYFLVPRTETALSTWRPVADEEAAKIWGKGPTNGTRPGGAGDPTAGSPGPEAGAEGPDDPVAGGQPSDSGPGTGSGCPLCTYDIKESSVSLTLSDVPVGYTPTIGPSMKVRISYNQREDSQPANFNFFNVSPKWTLDWLTYVIDDPSNPGANVSRYMSGGGEFYYLDYNATTRRFAAQDNDGSILSLVSEASGTYRRQMRDGRVEIYAQSDGSTAYPRRIFLSQIIDPQGNAATLHYDAQRRLTSITDAVGRDTTFSYEVPGKPLLVTKITDPFGRFAALTYDNQGRLSSITDIIGLTSSFTYNASSLVDSMTTPYGTTAFAFTAPGTVKPRFVQVTDPLGYKEREEWLEPAPIPASDPTNTVPVGMPITPQNAYLTYRNSFHWDKEAYVAAGCTDGGGCDYSKARVRHFVHMPGAAIKGTTIESSKNALENRIWFNYPGQDSPIYGGTNRQPIAIGRVLDDGTTQISRFEYDADNFFKVTKKVDPIGRTTNYAYSNGIDLVAVSQTTTLGVQSTLAQYNYNGQHRPTFYTDASGQTYAYTYNSAGQMASVTNPLGQKTTYSYDAEGNLASITNANNAVSASYTYDSFARIRTFTDSEGWTVTADYDAADRLTRLTYPDGTSEEFSYDKLDLASYRDREGRRWVYQHDANHRLVKFTHPSGRVVQLGYNGQDKLTSLIDPKGNETQWTYDLQGRAVGKEYANGSEESYAYELTISRLRSITDALNQSKQIAYATDNRPLSISYINAVSQTPNVTFTHDTFFPRISTMTDGVGTTTYEYTDPFSNGALALAAECFVATGQSACSHRIDYEYDALNRLEQRTVDGSGPETLSYDAINRIAEHTSDMGTFAISYLGETSQITERSLDSPGANLSTTWTYLNNLGDRRLASISNKGLAPGQFTDFAFTTTPDNLITGITQNSDAAVPVPDPAAQSATFNDVNELTSLSGQAYTYDANGNLLSDGARTYSWDAENRLIGTGFVDTPAREVTYSYDGLGRRVAITDDPGVGAATVRNFVWCGSRLCQARDESNGVERSYVEEGEVIASPASQPLYYGIDQIGSVRRVFVSTTEAPTVDYDPWGLPLQAAPATTDFGYAGLFTNDPADSYLTWFRAYDRNVGRWLSRDALGESSDPNANLFTYASLNPLNYTDRLGLFPRPSPSGLPCLSSGPAAPDGEPAEPAGWRKCLIQICVAAGLMTSNPTQPQTATLEDTPSPQTSVTIPDRRRPDKKR